MKKHGFMFAKHFGKMFLIWSKKEKKISCNKKFFNQDIGLHSKIEKDSQALIFIIVRALVVMADLSLAILIAYKSFIIMNCIYSDNSSLYTQRM